MTNNNASAVRTLKTIIEIIIVLSAVIFAWAYLRGDVNANTLQVGKNVAILNDVEKGVSEIKMDVREIQIDQKYIKAAVDEIKDKVK